eukprot:gene39171-47662_t
MASSSSSSAELLREEEDAPAGAVAGLEGWDVLAALGLLLFAGWASVAVLRGGDALGLESRGSAGKDKAEDAGGGTVAIRRAPSRGRSLLMSNSSSSYRSPRRANSSSREPLDAALLGLGGGSAPQQSFRCTPPSRLRDSGESSGSQRQQKLLSSRETAPLSEDGAATERTAHAPCRRGADGTGKAGVRPFPAMPSNRYSSLRDSRRETAAWHMRSCSGLPPLPPLPPPPARPSSASCSSSSSSSASSRGSAGCPPSPDSSPPPSPPASPRRRAAPSRRETADDSDSNHQDAGPGTGTETGTGTGTGRGRRRRDQDRQGQEDHGDQKDQDSQERRLLREITRRAYGLYGLDGHNEPGEADSEDGLPEGLLAAPKPSAFEPPLRPPPPPSAPPSAPLLSPPSLFAAGAAAGRRPVDSGATLTQCEVWVDA